MDYQDFWNCDEDDYSDVPWYGSEFEALIDELKETLKKNVAKEVQTELETLRARVAELEDFANDKEKYDRQLEELNRKFERQEFMVEKKAREMRLPEIMKALESPAWIPGWNYEYIYPKCDKCDKDRRIHFKSPSGKDLNEDCSCSKKRCVYRPLQGVMLNFRWEKGWESHFSDDIKREINGGRFEFVVPDTFKRKEIDKTMDRDTWYSEFSEFYHGQPFEKLGEYSRQYFRSLEDCQAYCDYRNKIEEEKANEN